MSAARPRRAVSPADEFFRELQAPKHFFPLLRHLSAAAAPGQPRYILCTDRSTARALRAIPDLALPIVTKPAVARLRGGSDAVYLVVSMKREEELIREFKQVLGRTRKGLLLGFLRDIYPFILTRSNMLNRFDPKSWDIEWIRRMRGRLLREVRDVVSYCIVCTPRSGSHFLCDLLRSAGLGDPKEHTKNPFVHLVQHSGRIGFSAERWVGVMRAYAAEGGVLGSKVVAHDLLKICNAQTDYLNLYDLVVYLYRRDKALQALSLVRARLKGVWHLREETPTLYAPLDYDYGHLMSTYDRLMSAEQRLAALVESTGQRTLLVEYEALASDPDATIRRIAELLKRVPSAAPISDEQVIRREQDLLHAERFARDAAAEDIVIERGYRPVIPGAF